MSEQTIERTEMPETFESHLLPFPFPDAEPPVEVVDLPGENLTVRCVDTQSWFTPLVEGGACDWCFYDVPGQWLSGVSQCRVVGTSHRGDKTIHRVWSRYIDFKNDEESEWREQHFLVEGDAFRWINLARAGSGGMLVSDFCWPGDPPDSAAPEPMQLSTGLVWDCGEGRRSKAVGVSRVTIGEQSWQCVKVVGPGLFGGADPDESATLLAEHYIAETGRTVFFRRYNGRSYAAPDKPRSFESLEGQIEIEFEGAPFRHSYDCVPDIALASVMG